MGKPRIFCLPLGFLLISWDLFPPRTEAATSGTPSSWGVNLALLTTVQLSLPFWASVSSSVEWG